MKNSIKLITWLVGGLFTFSSCTDLDVDLKSTYTEYPDSEIAKEAKMAGLYYGFGGALGRRYMEAALLSSDEFMAVTFGGNWYDGGNYIHSSLHASLPGDAHVDWAGDIPAAITKCNQAIFDLGGEDENNAEQEALIAPALAMRAFYHFIFMDTFGATPKLDHLIGDSEAIDRSPRSEITKFIESDLLRALASGGLKEDVDASTYGKPTKWMAEALLAKLYINWAVYTCDDVATYDPSMTNSKLNDVIKYCDDIIASGHFNLSDGYRKKFMPDNGYQIKDFIYAMPYQNNETSTRANTYARFQFWPKFNNDGADGKGLFGITLSKNAGGVFIVTPEAADRFCLEGDERNDIIMKGAINYYDISTHTMGTEPYIYNGQQVVLTKNITILNDQMDLGNDLNAWCQGYRCIKWAIQADDYNLYNRNQSNDVPIFRYADILLMVSDLMMPVMDGNELSRRVKANLATSHIPFLMLTALRSEAQERISYEIGVDEYLCKPFDEVILRLRIRNILALRQKYKSMFSTSMNCETLNINASSKDNTFMTSAINLMKEHYADSDYNLERFIRDMGYSKTLVNQKLQSLTGQSIGQFMRNYRLNVAKDTLTKVECDISVAEIAYAVGFNDPKYFTKCFKELFGVLPSEYFGKK